MEICPSLVPGINDAPQKRRITPFLFPPISCPRIGKLMGCPSAIINTYLVPHQMSGFTGPHAALTGSSPPEKSPPATSQSQRQHSFPGWRPTSTAGPVLTPRTHWVPSRYMAPHGAAQRRTGDRWRTCREQPFPSAWARYGHKAPCNPVSQTPYPPPPATTPKLCFVWRLHAEPNAVPLIWDWLGAVRRTVPFSGAGVGKGIEGEIKASEFASLDHVTAGSDLAPNLAQPICAENGLVRLLPAEAPGGLGPLPLSVREHISSQDWLLYAWPLPLSQVLSHHLPTLTVIHFCKRFMTSCSLALTPLSDRRSSCHRIALSLLPSSVTLVTISRWPVTEPVSLFSRLATSLACSTLLHACRQPDFLIL